MRAQVQPTGTGAATTRIADNRAADPASTYMLTRCINHATAQTMMAVKGRKARKSRACTVGPDSDRSGKVWGLPPAMRPTPRKTKPRDEFRAMGIAACFEKNGAP